VGKLVNRDVRWVPTRIGISHLLVELGVDEAHQVVVVAPVHHNARGHHMLPGQLLSSGAELSHIEYSLGPGVGKPVPLGLLHPCRDTHLELREVGGDHRTAPPSSFPHDVGGVHRLNACGLS